MSLQRDFVNSSISGALRTGSSCLVHAAQITFGQCLELFASCWNEERLDVFEAKIEESEKASSAGNRTQDTWLVQPVLCH